MKKIGLYLLVGFTGFCLWAVLFLGFMNAFSYFVFRPVNSIETFQESDHFIGLTHDVIVAPFYLPDFVIQAFSSPDTNVNFILGTFVVTVIFFLVGPYFWVPVFMIIFYIVKEIVIKKSSGSPPARG